jgi:hypothetical protein
MWLGRTGRADWTDVAGPHGACGLDWRAVGALSERGYSRR